MKTVIKILYALRDDYQQKIDDHVDNGYEKGSAVDSWVKNYRQYFEYYNNLAVIANKYIKLNEGIFIFILEAEYVKLRNETCHCRALRRLFDVGYIQELDLESRCDSAQKLFDQGDFKAASKELSRMALLINKLVGGGPEQCREEVTGLSTAGKNKNMSNSGFGGGAIVRLAAA